MSLKSVKDNESDTSTARVIFEAIHAKSGKCCWNMCYIYYHYKIYIVSLCTELKFLQALFHKKDSSSHSLHYSKTLVMILAVKFLCLCSAFFQDLKEKKMLWVRDFMRIVLWIPISYHTLVVHRKLINSK